MSEIFYALVLIGATGIISILLGTYIHFSKRNIAYGYAQFHAKFEVTDLKAYNQAVSRLWLFSGLATLSLCLILIIFQEGSAVIVALLAVAIYAYGSYVYVAKITPKYIKKKSHDDLWK